MILRIFTSFRCKILELLKKRGEICSILHTGYASYNEELHDYGTNKILVTKLRLRPQVKK